MHSAMIRHMFILFLLCQSLLAADGLGLFRTNVPLSEAHWAYYNGGDAPEGCWRGNVSFTGGTNFPYGGITWPSTLPAGTNYFIVKTLDYNGSNGVWFVVGNYSNYTGVNNDDWNKYYCAPVPVYTEFATNFFQMQFVHQPTNIANSGQQIVLGLYVTTNAYENVFAEDGTGYDYILDYRWNTNLDTSTAVKGNKVENGGFDVGITHGWGLYPTTTIRSNSITSMWDTTTFHDGVGSLHIPADDYIYSGGGGTPNQQIIVESKPFKLATNRQYSISVWTKELGGVNGSIVIRNPIDVPEGQGYSNTFSAGAIITANTSWHRTTLTTNFYCYPTDDFQIEIQVSTNTWIDSVQVEEGGLTDYLPSRAVELGVVTGRTGNLFTDNETVTLPVYGYSTNSGSIPLQWQVYDWLNRSVTNGNATLALSSNVLGSVNVTPTLTGPGVFRFVVWAVGQPHSTEESMFVVAPYIVPSKTNLFANTHATVAGYQQAPLFNSGMRMTRAMSTFQIFNTSVAEPTDDNFVYYDQYLGVFTNAGIGVLATLYNDGDKLTDMANWGEYVTNVVDHYKDRIDYWEIENEPLYLYTPLEYVAVLTNAARAIRAIDPTSFIVGMGGSHDQDWMSNVLHLLSPLDGYTWTNWMDIASTHLYPTTVDPSGGDTENKSSLTKTALAQWNPPIWNTEAGAYDLGMAVYNANHLSPGTALIPFLDSDRYHSGAHYQPELSIKNALTCFGRGQTKYFYYDSRIIGPHPSYYKSHPTDWEYDDSIKPKRILLSVLNDLIGEATGREKIPKATTTVYHFSQGSDSWLALWSSNTLPQTITFTNDTLTAFDAMGAPLTFTNYTAGSSTLLYGRKPVYVKAAGMGYATLSNITYTATVTNLNDTTPPNLSIDVAPRTLFTGSRFIFRWLAYDEVDIPSASTPDAILYATKYDSGSWSSWSGHITRTIEPVTSGVHTFTVAAKDSTGNAVTNSVVFNFDSHIITIGGSGSGTITIGGSGGTITIR